MTLNEATRAIESKNFAALMGLANSPTMFGDMARHDQFVMWLMSALETPDAQQKILQRILFLVREQDDVRFRSSSDAAIAVYLWCLGETNLALARLAATYVIGTPRLWWARKVALQLLGGATGSKSLAKRATITSVVATDSPIKAELSTDTSDTLAIPSPSRAPGEVLTPSAVTIRLDRDRAISEVGRSSLTTKNKRTRTQQ